MGGNGRAWRERETGKSEREGEVGRARESQGERGRARDGTGEDGTVGLREKARPGQHSPSLSAARAHCRCR